MIHLLFGHGRKPLSEILTRDSNNLDLVRLLAAIAVIYGHSFSLHASPVGSDMVHALTGIHAAEWGVKTFFFMSGLLVVNSVLSDGNPLAYTIRRLLRIWPALIFVILSTALIIGPLASTLSVSDYFADPQTEAYIRRMIMFDIWGNNNMALPGLFADNPYPNVVNAPLWTLSIEIYAYALIFILFFIGAFRKDAAVVVFGLFVLDSLLPEKVIFYWLPSNEPNFSAIPFCFALGGLLAVFKDKVTINLGLIFVLILANNLVGGGTKGVYFDYTVMFILVLYVAAMPLVVALPRLPDISYGVYLWGWPMQQLVSQTVPGISFFMNLIVTLALVFAAAIVSWYLVERPSIRMGQRIIKRYKARQTAKMSP